MNEPRDIHKQTLPNGLVVITEPMTHVRSVSVGIWVRTGSRRERTALNGITHFIEHMVFKGTERRSAEQIAKEVDSVGGMLDAFTSKEMICFNTKVLDEHLPLAFDVLADLVLRPRFDREDIEKEKGVILEEIKMDQDNPDYLVHEVFTQGFWRGHALGLPILGTPKSVKSFRQTAVLDCFREWFAPQNLVITAAGNLRHEQLLELVEKEFGSLKRGKANGAEREPRTNPHITLKSKRELEQAHICLGVAAYPMADERRFATAVLNNILGGGMSSRLFQNIREKRGLAYAVYSDVSPYRDTGLLSIYVGTALKTVSKVIELVMAEFRDLKENIVPAEELRRAKDYLKGSMMLSLESTSARMSNLARQELYFGRFVTMDELLASVEKVTAEDVQELSREFFRPKQIAATVLGNLNGHKVTRSHFEC
ncbi:MAG: insulinase family protein [Acidobacteria bacterium]|nr:insulinase family protein [Acidobacteriota bacterium]